MSQRKVPDLPPAKLEISRRAPLFQCQIEVVTPMFGGGHITRTVDPERPVTARSVRGHLRFWWRACKGAQYATARELYEAESALWGSTTTPSQVDVVVEVTNAGRDWRLSAQDRNNRLNYGLFAFKSDGNQPEATGREGVAFTVSFMANPQVNDQDISKVTNEVKAAVWAWLLFGGVGARTRRGCGSLYCSDGFKPGLGDHGQYVVSVEPRAGSRIPMLTNARLYQGNDSKDVMKAWEESNRWMFDFRQGPGTGRNRGDGPRPGRSFWPEPDSIRQITGTYAATHRPVHPAEVYFPRADLGLPIVFHMKTAGDPSDTLQPAGGGKVRMASPFILKPLMKAAGKAVPMVLLLNAPHAWDHPDGLELIGSGHLLASDEICDTSKNRRVGPLNGKPPREAFLEYVRHQLHGHMAEVTL